MNRLTLRSPLVLLLAALLPAAGCGDKGDDTGGTDTHTGDTSDTSDTGDTGETADTTDTTETGDSGGSAFTALTGSVTIQSTVGGAPLCDADIALTGTEYTGDCYDCTFGFDMSGSITRDDSDPNCSLSPVLTYIPSGGFDNLRMFFWSQYGASTNYLQTYFTYYFYGYGEYPYYYEMASDGNAYGSASLAGNNFTFDYSVTGYQYYYDTQFYNWCPWPVASDATTSFEGGAVGTGSLRCDESEQNAQHDIWQFTVNDPTTLHITVDTIADETAMDTRFWVNDPEGCTVMTADDNFACTFPPPDYQCSSAEIVDAVSGVWQVEVMPYYSCAGRTGDYQITVDGGSDLTLVTAAGKVEWSVGQREFIQNATMTATLTPR